MSKDVKIEVIYFKSSNDISIEFGLHGDYPVRLLTSVCNDITSLFRSLKRAVSRSEIIVLVGGYVGDEYLPSLVAKAIGKSCVEPDYHGLNIISKEKYIIPEGAVPLCSSRKLFGGFLIESGPQTIISLTDDKKIRLEIVNNFIVNYITEHYRVFNTANPIDNNSQDSDIETESINNKEDEKTSTNFSLSESENIFNENSSIDNEEEITEETEPTVYENTEFDTVVIDETITDNNEILLSDYQHTTEEQLIKPQATFKNSGELNKYINVRKRYYFIRIICLILSVLVLLGTTVSAFIFHYQNNHKNNTLVQNTYDFYYETDKLIKENQLNPKQVIDSIRKYNRDINYLISFPEIDLNAPVVSVSNGASIEYYLTYSPDGKPNNKGSLFIYNKSVSGNQNNNEKESNNLCIYGNATTNGIFQNLNDVYNEPEKYISTNITLSNEKSVSRWQIFSIFSHNSANGYNYEFYKYSDNQSYADYLTNLVNLSKNKPTVSFSGDEAIMLLIGIAENEKYIVAAFSDNIASDNTSVDGTSNNSSSQSVSSGTSSVEHEDEGDYENTPNSTPDIVLPPANNNTSSNTVTSQPTPSVSSNTSSVVSSQISSVKPPESSLEQQSSSSSASSIVSQPTSPSTPTVNPIYTWDINLSVIDKKTGIPYTDNAVTIVAMIIEIEMSPTKDPAEAVIAQAVASYNWLLNNGAQDPKTAPKVSLELPVTNKATEYANAAKGMLVMYGNTIAKTNYYAYSAGHTANTQDIWGGTAYEYLQSVDCSVDEQDPQFMTTKTYSAATIKQLIYEKCGIDVDASNLAPSDWIKPIEYDQNGLYCKYVNICGTVYRGKFLRETLLNWEIRSSAYTVEYNAEAETFTIITKGYGHGVGMSQRGAKAYAKLGWSCEQILTHFFPKTTVIKH